MKRSFQETVCYKCKHNIYYLTSILIGKRYLPTSKYQSRNVSMTDCCSYPVLSEKEAFIHCRIQT